jgi:hypothetical protein
MDWILFALIVGLWLGAILLDSTRYGRARSLRRFSRHVSLPLTDAVAAAIPRRLRRETVGAALGCVPALLVAFALAIWSPELLNGASGSVIVPLMIAGAALGIAIASATRLSSPNTDTPRVARTIVPQITDYISAVWIVASSALCVAGLLFAALALPRAKAGTPLVVTTIAILAAGILTLALCTGLSRRLLTAPQPAHDSIELAWDDAVRAHAFRSLWTAPLAMGLVAAYLAISLSLAGAQSPPIIAFILVITVVQVLLQLSRPGKRFRQRLWPNLAVQAPERAIA